MFVHTHTKKSDRTIFVDERERQAHDRYNELVAVASQTVEGAAESSQIDENKLYLDAVDGIKKRRIYGLGSCASSYIVASSQSTAGTPKRGYRSRCSYARRSATSCMRRSGMSCATSCVVICTPRLAPR